MGFAQSGAIPHRLIIYFFKDTVIMYNYHLYQENIRRACRSMGNLATSYGLCHKFNPISTANLFPYMPYKVLLCAMATKQK